MVDRRSRRRRRSRDEIKEYRQPRPPPIQSETRNMFNRQLFKSQERQSVSQSTAGRTRRSVDAGLKDRSTDGATFNTR